jgi:hypothetical protein
MAALAAILLVLALWVVLSWAAIAVWRWVDRTFLTP